VDAVDRRGRLHDPPQSETGGSDLGRRPADRPTDAALVDDGVASVHATTAAIMAFDFLLVFCGELSPCSSVVASFRPLEP